ncbi:MAG: hypothetical protein ACKOET_06705, partial [Verrucomicrobiota bacterium]
GGGPGRRGWLARGLGWTGTGTGLLAAVRRPPPLPVADPAAAAGAAQELRDIRGAVDLPDPWLWVERGGVAALALGLGTLGFWLWWRRRGRPAPAEAPDPAAVAWEKIEAAAALRPEAKPYVQAVSEAVRGYLEARFGLRAPDRTTEEFLAELSANPVLDARHHEALGGFLQQCDLVKFAPHRPNPADLDDLGDLARRLVRETRPVGAVPAPGTGARSPGRVA